MVSMRWLSRPRASLPVTSRTVMPDASVRSTMFSSDIGYSVSRASLLYQGQNGRRRVSLQPVVHEEKEELLVLPGAADQHFHRFARFRVRVLHVGVRCESLDCLFIDAPLAQQCPADGEVGGLRP